LNSLNNENSKDTRNCLIVLEINGFQVSKSFNLKFNKKSFYLFPENFFKYIKVLKNTIKSIRLSKSKTYNSYEFHPLQFISGPKRYSYLITNHEINLKNEKLQIFNEIENSELIARFIQVNSFLFNNFLEISRIFIYNSNFQLKRILTQKIRKKIIYPTERVYIFDDYDEKIIDMMKRFDNNDFNRSVAKLFLELILAKNVSYIETRVIFLWNYLEHLTRLYARFNKKDLLIDSSKFESLKKEIGEIVKKEINSINSTLGIQEEKLLNEFNRIFNESIDEGYINSKQLRQIKKQIREKIKSTLRNRDIFIQGYDKNKISGIITNKIDNFPNIENLVQIMAKSVGYYIPKEENEIIKLMHLARNQMFHNSLDIDILLNKLTQQINKLKNSTSLKIDFDHFSNLINKFEKILDKITKKVLKFPEFEMKRGSISPSIRFINPETDPQMFFINFFKNLLNKFSEEKKYSFIICLILFFKKEYEKIFNKDFNAEYHFLDNKTDIYNASIEFSDEFSGYIKDHEKITKYLKFKVFLTRRNFFIKGNINFIAELEGDYLTDQKKFFDTEYLDIILF